LRALLRGMERGDGPRYPRSHICCAGGHDFDASAGRGTGAAQAEAPVAPRSEQLDANGCVHDRATVREGGDLDAATAGGRNLSDKFARSGGVICPPSQVDPAIRAPTPPGSSGGDPNVQPK
jgi:hypothetical protein